MLTCVQSELQLSSTAFGKPLRRKLFALSEDWTFINHGAFGGAFLPALQEGHAWEIHAVCMRLLSRYMHDTS